MTKNFKWTIRADIRWCTNCNIPLISPKCSICGEIGGKLHASPPMDVRPAFKGDLERIRRSIINEFEDKKTLKILVPKNKLILLNKVVYIDQADEVIVDGWTIGHCFYDPINEKWRFKPVAEGCARLLESKLGYWVQIKYEKVKLWEKLSRSDITRGELPEEDGKFIAIASKRGSSIGLGVYEKNSIKIIKTWKKQKTHIKRASSNISKAIKGNIVQLQNSERKAKIFIEKINKEIGKPVVVSFSGGKDSLATLILTLETLGETPIMFNDTGIELPETIENVYHTADKYELKLIEASAKDNFWKSFKIFGPPARDYRWCCKVCKLIPIATTMKNNFPNGSLNLVGQRKFESLARSRSPQVWKNKWMPGIIGASPIIDWTALHIWLYLTMKKCDANKLYFKGFDRIGCWLCPSCELAEFKLVSQIHPNLWRKWETHLYTWAQTKNLPKEWVKYGFWRWQKLPGDQIRFAKKMGIEMEIKEAREKRLPTKIMKIKGYEPCVNTYAIEAILDVKVDLKKIANVAPIMGETKYSPKLRTLIIKNEKGDINISNTGRISVTSSNEEKAEKLFKETLRLISRSIFCSLCYSCINSCPNKAIVKDKPPRVINEKCIRCMKCQRACPSADYIGKMLIEQSRLMVK